MSMKTKLFENALLKTYGVGDRQIKVIASTPAPDRSGDVMLPQGCVLDNFRRNNIVLVNHNPDSPIGSAAVEVKNNRLEALIEFAPKGASALADEWLALCKAAIVSSCSVGFTPLDMEPRKGGGYTIKSWELLELSLCSVPCNPEAVILQRSFSGGRLTPRAPVMMSRTARLAEIAVFGAEAPSAPPQLSQRQMFSANETARVLRMSGALYANDPETRRKQRALDLQRLAR